MSQLARITQALNALADERWTTPDDVLGTANERGDAFERVVEELDEHKRSALADAKEGADVVAEAQRLKDATDERVAVFTEMLVDVIEERYRVVEAEYDARIKAKSEEYDALIEPLVAELEKLRGEKETAVGVLSCEKSSKLEELLSLVDFDDFGAPDKRDSLYVTKCTGQLKEWTGKKVAAIVYDSTVDPFTADGLFNKVKGKENIAIIGTTTEGDVFGGFYSVSVTEQEKEFFDPDVFAFSLSPTGGARHQSVFSVKERVRDKAYVKPCTNNVFGVCPDLRGRCWWLLARERELQLVLSEHVPLV